MPPFFRAMAYAIYPLVSAANSWDTVVPLLMEAINRLNFLLVNATMINGRCFRYDPSIASVLVTDACPQRWTWAVTRGALAGHSCNGLWTDVPLPFFLTDLSSHINSHVTHALRD